MEDRPSHAYLGLKKCGCFGFIGGDEPSLAKDNAKDSAWLVKNSGTVERLPVDEAKVRLLMIPHGCAECDPKPAVEQRSLFG
jgi:hypothetical protein